MKENSVLLEYCVAQDGKMDKWGFRFRSQTGKTLVESPKAFNSKAEAEEGLVSLIKSVTASRVFRLLADLKPNQAMISTGG